MDMERIDQDAEHPDRSPRPASRFAEQALQCAFSSYRELPAATPMAYRGRFGAPSPLQLSETGLCKPGPLPWPRRRFAVSFVLGSRGAWVALYVWDVRNAARGHRESDVHRLAPRGPAIRLGTRTERCDCGRARQLEPVDRGIEGRHWERPVPAGNASASYRLA